MHVTTAHPNRLFFIFRRLFDSCHSYLHNCEIDTETDTDTTAHHTDNDDNDDNAPADVVAVSVSRDVARRYMEQYISAIHQTVAHVTTPAMFGDYLQDEYSQLVQHVSLHYLYSENHCLAETVFRWLDVDVEVNATGRQPTTTTTAFASNTNTTHTNTNTHTNTTHTNTNTHTNTTHTNTNTHTTTPEAFRIYVPDADESYVRHVVANRLGVSSDCVELDVSWDDSRVRCVVHHAHRRPHSRPSSSSSSSSSSSHTVVLRVSVVSPHSGGGGEPLVQYTGTFYTGATMHQTVDAVMHHPRVRNWMYATGYTGGDEHVAVVPFLHTAVCTRPLHAHPLLRPYDRLSCVVFTAAEYAATRDAIRRFAAGGWAHVARGATAHVSTQQHTKHHHHTNHLTRLVRSLRLNVFDAYICSHFAEVAAFRFRVAVLHTRQRHHQQLRSWVRLHGTLLADSIWDDGARYTTDTFRHDEAAMAICAHPEKHMTDHREFVMAAILHKHAPVPSAKLIGHMCERWQSRVGGQSWGNAAHRLERPPPPSGREPR
jgi:hypothetical protein